MIASWKESPHTVHYRAELNKGVNIFILSKYIKESHSFKRSSMIVGFWFDLVWFSLAEENETQNYLRSH